MRRAGSEADLHKLNAAVGGSATARRLQSAGVSHGELGIDIAEKAIKGGLFGSVLKAAGTAAKGAITRGTARAMGPSLLTQGTPAIDQFLTSLHSSEPLVNSLFSKALPAVASKPGMSLFQR